MASHPRLECRSRQRKEGFIFNKVRERGDSEYVRTIQKQCYTSLRISPWPAIYLLTARCTYVRGDGNRALQVLLMRPYMYSSKLEAKRGCVQILSVQVQESVIKNQ